MTPPHPLDRPIWSALTGRQAPLAVGDGRARRFAPEYGPFGAAADGSPAGLEALGDLARAHGGLIVVEAEPVPPPGLEVRPYPAVHQMVWTAPAAPAEADFAFAALGDADAGEMYDLAHLTKPGPYAALTHRLGGFLGVRDEGGRLVAMAGERMKPDGFAEVSGVCTHPDHRGRGLAAGLMRTVIARILARGETPFLHSYAKNTGAMALYETLGFAFRREMTMLGLGA